MRCCPLSTSRIIPGHVPMNAEAGTWRFVTARRGKEIGFRPRRGDEQLTMTASSVISRSEDFCCKRGHPAILRARAYEIYAQSSYSESVEGSVETQGRMRVGCMHVFGLVGGSRWLPGRQGIRPQCASHSTRLVSARQDIGVSLRWSDQHSPEID